MHGYLIENFTAIVWVYWYWGSTASPGPDLLNLKIHKWRMTLKRDLSLTTYLIENFFLWVGTSALWWVMTMGNVWSPSVTGQMPLVTPGAGHQDITLHHYSIRTQYGDNTDEWPSSEPPLPMMYWWQYRWLTPQSTPILRHYHGTPGWHTLITTQIWETLMSTCTETSVSRFLQGRVAENLLKVR